jgi:4-amino-4-deoxy-L-arabinose transferase-like glycosyltransferase
MIYLGAFFARVSAMFWDLYANHIFSLPGSGGDSVGFYNTAVRISSDLGLLAESAYGGYYSKLNGLLFYFVGPYQILGQYLNVLLGLSIVFIIYRILSLLSINQKEKKLILILAAFFPNSIVMSAIFLRETIITFFVCVSLYMFIKWFKTDKYSFMLLSFAMLGVGCVFHSGVVGIALGYSFAFLFYKNNQKSLRFSLKSVTSFLVILAVFSLAFTVFYDTIFAKFGSLEDVNDIYRIGTSSGRGGSAYLRGLTINNPLELAAYGPVKSFYFLASPLPMDWRGITDIFTFFTDSLLYTGVIAYLIINRKKLDNRRILTILLVMMIMGASTIFGIGVSNAGTALRHRQKLIPVFLVLLAIMVDGRHSYRSKFAIKKHVRVARGVR